MKWFEVMAKAAIGEIYIYGVIDSEQWWGDEVTPTNIQKELEKLKDVDEINVYINSPGGNVFAGVAIYNELKRLNKPVTAYVDGLAASIASLIVLAADKVVMPVNAMLMIHNATMCVCGDAQQLRDMGDKLDKIQDATIVTVYEAKTSISKEKLLDMMAAETWLNGSEAVELGFADEVAEDMKVAACIADKSVKFGNIEVQIRDYKSFSKDKITEYKPKNKLSLETRHKHTMFNMLSAQL